jgi:hypothetical protein
VNDKLLNFILIKKQRRAISKISGKFVVRSGETGQDRYE